MIKSLTLVKGLKINDMDIQATKLELMELLLSTQKEGVLKRLKEIFEQESSNDAFYATTEEQLQERAKASLESINGGATRNINEFKKEVEEWKQKKAI